MIPTHTPGDLSESPGIPSQLPSKHKQVESLSLSCWLMVYSELEASGVALDSSAWLSRAHACAGAAHTAEAELSIQRAIDGALSAEVGALLIAQLMARHATPQQFGAREIMQGRLWGKS